MNAAWTGCNTSPCAAFDRRDLRPARLHREHQAGVHEATVDVNGAGAALTVVATLLGSRETDALAQRIEQRDSSIDAHLHGAAVDVERDHLLAGNRRASDRQRRRRDSAEAGPPPL